jgi:hypothetical protein
LTDLKLFHIIVFQIFGVTILRMHTKFFAVFLIIALLSQQAISGVVSAAMMGSTALDSSTTTDMSHHQHHDMASQPNMGEMSNTQMKECCQSDCAYCIVGCYSILNSMAIKPLPVFTQIPSQQSIIEPRVQSLDSPFRPPIFA